MMPGRAWVLLLAAVAATVTTAGLGWWQLGRAQLKRSLQDELENRITLPPLPRDALARTPAEASDQLHRLVSLRGHWLHQQTVYLENRPMQGRPGFIVITPLELGTGDAVLVQRGWVARDPYDRTRVQPVAAPGGEVVVHGRLAWPPSPLMELGAPPTRPGAIRHNLDLAAFSRESGLALRPLTVLELDAPGAAVGPLQRQWALPSHNIATHHGYAVQWFSLSALIAGLYVWFQILLPRRRSAG
jgi:surfeit locus 1 family protein